MSKYRISPKDLLIARMNVLARAVEIAVAKKDEEPIEGKKILQMADALEKWLLKDFEVSEAVPSSSGKPSIKNPNEPASENQKKFIRSLAGEVGYQVSEEEIANLSKKEASQLIDKLTSMKNKPKSPPNDSEIPF